MLLIVLIFCFATSVYTQTIGFGHCPDVEVMKSFDANKLDGVWYENQRSVPNMHEANVRCMRANFSHIDENAMKLVVRGVSTLTGKETTVTALGKLDDGVNCDGNSTDCANGKIIYEFPIGIAGHYSRSYSILDTDYTSFAVFWSCDNYIFTHGKYLWIFTRDEKAPDAAVEKANDVILKNRVDNVPMSVTNQDNCPE